jgi:glycine oxidase
VKITVVGAGIVGCAIAHELASRGVRVHLVDSRGIGRGATRASAGILAPQIEGHIPALRDLAACSLAMYDDFVRRVERDARRTIEYRRSGTLQVAFDDVEASALSTTARFLTSVGVAHTLLDGDATRQLEPALCDRVKAGLLVSAHGYVAAAPLTDALADAARSRGVQLSTAPVIAIDGGATVTRVMTGHETIESDGVIVATGTWPVPPRAPDAPGVKPIRGQLLVLRCENAVAARVLWGQACYVVPWSDGTVLVGATVEDVGFDERSTAEGVRGLLGAAIGILPSLEGAHFEEVRVGLRPKTVDELPIIGRSDVVPHMFYALGHFRNGVLLAPLTAALVADLVIDGKERPELSLVRPGRLTTA